MNTFRIITRTFLCWLAASSAFAQSAPEIKFWKKAVAEKSPSQLASLLDDPSTPAWPKAASSYSIQKLPGEQRALADDAIALVKALHAKAQREFSRTTQGANDEPRTYATLATALERAGGYSNMVLADSFRRLALFRLSAAVVRGSRPMTDVRREVEQTAVPHVEIRSLLERLAPDDEALIGKESELGKITPDQNVYAALQAARLGDPSSLSGQPFGQLIESPSAVALMLRMAGTELLYTVSLNGLLTFLENGGTYAELNPADMTAFKARMGGATKSFQYPPLGVRSLSVSHPRSLFELHNEPAAQAAFLKIALD